MRRLLLSLFVLASMTLFSVAQPANDRCGGAVNLCTEKIPGFLSTSATHTNSVSCNGTTGRDVWYEFTGALGGSIDIQLTDNDDCLYFEVFTGCPFPSSVAGTCTQALSGFGGVISGLTITAGTTYYIVIKGCTGTDGGLFYLQIINNDPDAAIANPDPGFSIPPLTCVNEIVTLENTSIEHGGTVVYEWEIDGTVDGSFPERPTLGNDSLLSFTSSGTKEIILRADNGCIPASELSKEIVVQELIARIDSFTPDPSCAGTPLTFYASDTLEPYHFLRETPDVTAWKWFYTEYEDPFTRFTTVHLYQDTINPAILPDTFLVAAGTTWVLMDTIVPSPGPMQDTIAPTEDSIEVMLIVTGTCGADTAYETVDLLPTLRVEQPTDTNFCFDDKGNMIYDVAIGDILTGINAGDLSGIAPFMYEFYYDTVEASKLYDVFGDGITDTIDTIVSSSDIGTNVTFGTIRDLYSFYNDSVFGDTFRLITKVTDSRGCIGFDTTNVYITKPSIDSFHINDWTDATENCLNDHEGLADPGMECPTFYPDVTMGQEDYKPAQNIGMGDWAFCPGEIIPLSFKVRYIPGMRYNLYESDLLGTTLTRVTGQIFPGETDYIIPDGDPFTLTDSTNHSQYMGLNYFFRDREKEADFTMALVATDTFGCNDTAWVCIPIHEPPTETVDPFCGGDTPTDTMFQIEGACDGSKYDWYIIDPVLGILEPDFYWSADSDTLMTQYLTDTSYLRFDFNDTNRILAADLPDSVFEFRCIVTDAVTGCIDTVEFTFQVGTQFTVTLTPADQEVCLGETVSIFADMGGADTTGMSWTWEEWPYDSVNAIPQGSPIPIVGAIDSIGLDYDMTDSAWIIVTVVQGGCINADTIDIWVDTIPAIDITNNDTVCSCDSVTLSAVGSDLTNKVITWTFNRADSNTVVFDTAVTTRAQVCATDTFYLNILDTITDCDKDTMMFVTVVPNPTPVLDMKGTDTLCLEPGDSVDIPLDGKASVIAANMSYLWTSTTGAPALNIDDPIADSTFVRVFATDTMIEICMTITDTSNGNTEGCDTTICDTVWIFEEPLVISSSAIPNDTVCECDSVTIGFGLTDSTDLIYTWVADNGSFVRDPNMLSTRVEACISDTFRLNIFDTVGMCTIDTLIGITVQPQPGISIDSLYSSTTGLQTICRATADSVLLWGSSADAPVTYLWTSSVDSASGVYIPDSTTDSTYALIDTSVTSNVVFCLTIENPFGCDTMICDTLFIYEQPTDSLTSNSFCILDSPKVDTLCAILAIPNHTAEYNWIIDTPTVIIDTFLNNSFGDSSCAVVDLRNLPSDSTFLMRVEVINDTSGCTDTVDFNITIISPGVANVLDINADTVSGDTVFACSGDLVTLIGVDKVNYEWWGDAALTAAPLFALSAVNIDSLVIQPTTLIDTTFLYCLQGGAGVSDSCKADTCVYVRVHPLPEVDAGTDTAICINDTISLNSTVTVSGIGGPYQYIWNPAGSLDDSSLADPRAYPTVTTMYYLSIVDSGDTNTLCASPMDSVLVTVNSLPVVDATPAAADSVLICYGDSITIGGSPTASGNGGFIYTWNPNDSINDSTVANPMVWPTDTTQYMVLVEDANTCKDMDTVTVLVNPEFTLDAGADTIICIDDSATLGGSPTISGGNGGYAFAWTDAATINDTTLANPKASPPSDQMFYVTVTDASACTISDSMMVSVTDSPVINTLTSVPDSICKEGSLTLTMTVSNTDTIRWTENIGGTYDDDTILTPIYTVPAGYVGSDTVFVTVGNAQCGTITDFRTFTVIDSAVAIASIPVDTICTGTTLQLNGDTTNASSVTWFEAAGGPGGVFANANDDTTTYTPPALFDGPVKIYFEAFDINGICPADRDSVEFYVQALPDANPGLDTTICVNDCFALNASGDHGIISWDDQGNGGTFTPSDSNNAVYCPPAGLFGVIYLRQTITSPWPACGTDTDSLRFVISDSTSAQIVLPTKDTTICQGDTIALKAIINNNNFQTWYVNGVAFSNLDSTSYFPAIGGTDTIVIVGENNTPCPDATDTMIVVVVAPATAVVGATSDLCKGDSLYLSGGGLNGTITWASNVGGFYPNNIGNNPIYAPPAGFTGQVILSQTVTSPFAPCGVDVMSDTITVHDSTTVSITLPTSDTSICNGVTLNLIGTATNSAAVQWISTGGSAIVPPASLTPTYTPFSAGLDTVYLVSVNGTPCPEDTAMMVFDVHEIPGITVAADPMNACQGDTIQLTSIPVGIDGTITWSDNSGGGSFDLPNITNPRYVADPDSIFTSHSVMITVVATSSLCGTAYDTINVNFRRIPDVSFVTDSIDNICGSDQLILRAEGATRYAWVASTSPTDTTFTNIIDSVIFFPTATTIYTVIGTISGCSATDTTARNIRPNPIPTIYSNYPEGSCYPVSVDFSFDYAQHGVTPEEEGISIVNRLWNFGDGDTLSSLGSNVSHTYLESLDSSYPVAYNVILKVDYSNGCSAEVKTVADIELCENFNVPNVFTPGTGGQNALFDIKGIDDKVCELIVFNRWGEKVFETSAYNNDWNGTSTKGDDLKSGVYYYILNCDDNSSITGWVKIIRAD